MPISFQIDPARNFLLGRAEGVVTAEELLAFARDLARHPHFQARLRQLCDCRDLQQFDAGMEEFLAVKEIAQGMAEKLEGGRLALVADRDCVFGVLRMYQMALDGLPLEIQVFRDMDEARVWLGAEESRTSYEPGRAVSRGARDRDRDETGRV